MADWARAQGPPPKRGAPTKKGAPPNGASQPPHPRLKSPAIIIPHCFLTKSIHAMIWSRIFNSQFTVRSRAKRIH